MGYYMRYILDDSHAKSLDVIDRALKSVDSGYHLAARNDEKEYDLMLGRLCLFQAGPVWPALPERYRLVCRTW
jgi:hypothetical protein